jgi:fructose-specific phosphotransferase system IIC component
MTADNLTPVEPQAPSRTAKGRRFLWMLAGLIGVCAVCGWVSLGVGLYLDVPKGTRLILAVVAAVATEALFWTCAAALGVSVFEARKRIWRKITGRA